MSTELRGRILDVSVQLFMERGYQSTSLNDIILATGCSKGAFYHHFRSKDDLLLIIHERVMDDGIEVARRIAEQPGTATERLATFIRAFVDNVVRNRADLTVFLEEHRFLSTDAFAQVTRKRREFEDIVVHLIEAGIADGELRSGLDARVAAKGIFGVVNWCYRWVDEHGRLSVAEVGDMLSTMVLSGLASPTRASRRGRPLSVDRA